MARSIRVIKVSHPRVPFMVAIPASVTGTRRVRRYFKDRTAALAYIVAVKQQGFLGAEGPPAAPGKVSLGEAAALWVAKHEEYRRTFYQIRPIMARLVARHGRDPVDAVGHRELDAWLRSLNGLSAVTIHNHFRIVKRFFGWCQDYLEAIPRNPMKRLKERRLEHQEPAILTPAQMAQCLAAAKGNRPLTAFLSLAGFAGLRTDEILRQQWDDIDWGAGEIYVRQPKRVAGWRPRRVEILPALRRHLEPLAQPAGKVAPGGERALYKLRRGLMDTLGWPSWPPNCLRHSYKSYHLAQWQDRSRLAEQMGHSGTDMARYNYGSPVVRQAAGAWWRL